MLCLAMVDIGILDVLPNYQVDYHSFETGMLVFISRDFSVTKTLGSLALPFGIPGPRDQ